MAVVDGRTWMSHLSFDECWIRLQATPVGRLALVVKGDPEIYPVNFVVDERSIVFRTDPGSKLRGLRRDAVVCFEVDAIDIQAQTGWSVMVKGSAAEVHGTEEAQRVAELPLTYWAAGHKAHFVRITPTTVTGREIRPRS